MNCSYRMFTSLSRFAHWFFFLVSNFFKYLEEEIFGLYRCHPSRDIMYNWPLLGILGFSLTNSWRKLQECSILM
uniref:Uncharacterized protein n=1 Tax=Anguilla anguilla TaxID=7936 RepID=A0A0E9QYU9_ANGAN